MRTSVLAIAVIAVCVNVAGCQRNSDEASTAEPAVAGQTPAAASAPIDTAKEIAVLKSLNVELRQDVPPKLTAGGTAVALPVTINNKGSSEIGGTAMPINLGVQILGDDGTLRGSGAQRDFVRMKIPALAPGATQTVVVDVPLSARTEDRVLRVDLVREKVAWFENIGHTPLDVGPFSVCGAALCDQPVQQ